MVAVVLTLINTAFFCGNMVLSRQKFDIRKTN